MHCTVVSHCLPDLMLMAHLVPQTHQPGQPVKVPNQLYLQEYLVLALPAMLPNQLHHQGHLVLALPGMLPELLMPFCFVKKNLTWLWCCCFPLLLDLMLMAHSVLQPHQPGQPAKVQKPVNPLFHLLRRQVREQGKEMEMIRHLLLLYKLRTIQASDQQLRRLLQPHPIKNTNRKLDNK